MTLRTASEHRGRAAQLRAQGTPKAIEVAEQLENVARMIEHRERKGPVLPRVLLGPPLVPC